MVETKVDSFFNIFKTLVDPDAEGETDEKDKKEGEEDDDEEGDEDYDT
jgi:hypothetical protein